MKTRTIALLALVLVVLGTAISGCGPSPEDVYAEAMVPALENYFAKLTSMSEALGASGELTDPAYQEKLTAAMNELDAASADLGKVNVEVPESMATLDGYIQEIGSETTVFTDSIRGILDEANAGNSEAMMAKLDEMQASLGKLTDLMDQTNAEIDRINQ